MTREVNWTTRFRLAFVTLFFSVILAAVIGWFLGKDPNQLAAVITSSAGAIGVGELANVGKRYTYRKEVEHEEFWQPAPGEEP